MARIDPNIPRKGSSTIKFTSFLRLLIANTGRDSILSGEIAPFMIQYLNENSDFEGILGSIPVSAQFVRFIITCLFILDDREFGGRIAWRNFQLLDFLETVK
jgi:hypothetical protein